MQWQLRSFEVLGPRTGEDGLFVRLVGHERLEDADAAYYASPERAAFDPDPARHIAEIQTWLLEGR